MPDGPKVIDTYLFHFPPQKWKDALHARASFLLKGRSAVGRAPVLYTASRRFDSCRPYQKTYQTEGGDA